VLAFLLDRLTELPVVSLVVATSKLDRDDPVAELAAETGVGVVRGPEDDVLARFVLALDEVPRARHVIRITADCPLTDPDIVDEVVRTHLERQADYTSNVLPRTFPKGLDVEVATTAALRTAAAEATLRREREHVMPFLYRHPERFVLANVRSGADLRDERWTIDTPDDLAAVRELVAHFRPGDRFGWRDALEAVGQRVEVGADELRLRPAELGDRDRLLAWRNDADSVRFSLSGTAVGVDEHEQWFARRLDDPGTRLEIGERAGEAVGMVRVDVEAAVGTVSIAVAPEHRGHGLASRLLRALQRELAGDPQVDRLLAQVVEANTASARAFRSAGFASQGVVSGVETLTWENPGT
jgi:spore coat polysaccharide biosynthesis protein SpsF